MILMAYRHRLRASEVTDLKWEQVDFDRSEILRKPAQGRHASNASPGNCASSAVTSATARRRPLCLYRSAGHR